MVAIAELTAIRGQSQADAERAIAAIERLEPEITSDSLKRFAAAVGAEADMPFTNGLKTDVSIVPESDGSDGIRMRPSSRSRRHRPGRLAGDHAAADLIGGSCIAGFHQP